MISSFEKLKNTPYLIGDKVKNMRLHATTHKKGLICVSLTIILVISVIAILNFVPQVSGLTLDASTVCSGWTSDKQPVAASSFMSGQTVYLYYSTSDNGYVSGDSISFTLVDPNGQVWNTYASREEYNMQTATYTSPSGSTAQTQSSSFLKVLDVTSDIQIGTWQITGYYGGTLLFQQNFEVVAGQAAPSSIFTIPSYTDTIPSYTDTPTTLDNSGSLEIAGVAFFIIFIVVILVVIVAVFMRMDKKHKQATQTPPPQTN